jgi:hypothetical protein
VADLRANALNVEAELLKLGEEGIERLDIRSFRPVRLTE